MRVFAWIEKVVDGFVSLLLVVVLGASTYQIVSRYLLAQPLDWSESLAKYAMVWLTFLGAATAYRRREHFALETRLVRLLPRPLLVALELSLTAAFSGFLFWAGWQQTLLSWPVWAPELGIRLSVLDVCVPIAALLIALFAIESALEGGKDRRDKDRSEEPLL